MYYHDCEFLNKRAHSEIFDGVAKNILLEVKATIVSEISNSGKMKFTDGSKFTVPKIKSFASSGESEKMAI